MIQPPNEYQYLKGPADAFIKTGKMFIHELRFIAKKKGIPKYLEMSKDELSEAILNYKKIK